MTVALAECEDALYTIELGATAEDDLLTGREPGETLPERPRPADLVPAWALSLLIDLDAVGATVVLALDRRPPLLVSHDGGASWSERGGGLPKGRAVAIGESPDDVLFAARNRLYVSRDGARFWRAVAIELPEIASVAWG